MAEFDFRSPEITDCEWVKPLLAKSGFRGCLYTFGNNYMWKDVYNIKICRRNDFYLLQNRYHSDIPGFLYPAGSGDIRRLIEELRSYCTANGYPLQMAANRECTELLREMYPDIIAEPDRSGFDYVYEAAALADLKGRKYHSKRNHLNRFYENNWSFEKITADNIRYCREVLEQWLAADPEPDSNKLEEAGVVQRSLEYYTQLGYFGGVLFVNGSPQAFTFGECSAADTFVVHAEKALLNYQGAYTAVNCEFAKLLSVDYRYINREDDTGAEGLRKAKLSYHPAFMEEKYFITFGGTT